MLYVWKNITRQQLGIVEVMSPPTTRRTKKKSNLKTFKIVFTSPVFYLILHNVILYFLFLLHSSKYEPGFTLKDVFLVYSLNFATVQLFYFTHTRVTFISILSGLFWLFFEVISCIPLLHYFNPQ